MIWMSFNMWINRPKLSLLVTCFSQLQICCKMLGNVFSHSLVGKFMDMELLGQTFAHFKFW